MFQFRLPQLPTLSSFSFGGGIRVPKAEVHDVEERPEKRARTLKHLIKHNHISHSIIYNELRFHNHVPHVLGSAYIFGAESEQLNDIYEHAGKDLEPWTDSPGEISKHDWTEFLGKRQYQRAFIDFFEDQLVELGYDWHALLNDFLLSGKQPLINNLISGLAHPLIHLGYAHELASRTVAVEALALAACFHNDWHVYLEDPKYTKPAPHPTDSLFSILDRVSSDTRFESLSGKSGSDGIDEILHNDLTAAAVLEHWNSWNLEKPTEQFAESQKLAVALAVAARDGKTGKSVHDFFLVHALTSSHAVRTLLPILPAKWHVPLVRQWWLFLLLAFIAQGRPRTNIDEIKLVELESRDWRYIAHNALAGDHRMDEHFVKALRCIQEAGKTWGDPNQFYLKAAVKLADEFEGWGGFGTE